MEYASQSLIVVEDEPLIGIMIEDISWQVDHAELIRLSGSIYCRLFERQVLELTKGLKIA